MRCNILTSEMPLIDRVTMASTDQSFGKSQPIEVLPTELARILTNVHPVLLLSAYYLRFPALVADPIIALLQSLPILAMSQIAYATVCLPPTGSGTSSKPNKKSRQGIKKADTSRSKAIVSSVSGRSVKDINEIVDRILRPHSIPFFRTYPSRLASPLWSSNHYTYPADPPQFLSYSLAGYLSFGICAWI